MNEGAVKTARQLFKVSTIDFVEALVTRSARWGSSIGASVSVEAKQIAAT